MVDGSVVLEVEGAEYIVHSSLPPAAAASKAATAHCIIVSFCHMMAMASTAHCPPLVHLVQFRVW